MEATLLVDRMAFTPAGELHVPRSARSQAQVALSFPVPPPPVPRRLEFELVMLASEFILDDALARIRAAGPIAAPDELLRLAELAAAHQVEKEDASAWAARQSSSEPSRVV